VNKENSHLLTDQELLENFYKDRNNDWLGILLQRYILLLFGVCMKYLKNEEEAKDAVQQIFLKSITELQKYKVSFFKSWIYMVARNHCLMQLRNRLAKTPAPLNENHGGLTEEQALAGNRLEKEQLLRMMEDSLEDLSEEQRRCLKLFYLEKKSYHEIEVNTGFSAMQVKSYIQNGKRNLRIILDKKIKAFSNE